MKAVKVSLLNVIAMIFTSVGFLPRALVLGAGNKGQKGDQRSNRQQKQGGSVVRGNSSTAVSMEDKLMKAKPVEDKVMEDKLLSKSAQSLSCHMRSPDGRMLA